MKKRLKLNKINFFPVSKPHVSKKDIIAVNKVLKNGWISSIGPEINKFEKQFSKLVGRKYSPMAVNMTMEEWYTGLAMLGYMSSGERIALDCEVNMMAIARKSRNQARHIIKILGEKNETE